MHAGMNLQEMLTEVVRQSESKRDFVADTRETIRMVAMPEFDKGVALVMLENKPLHVVGYDKTNMLERFEITDHCHNQIAQRLGIPRKYYDRLLDDHRDLVIHNVNTLFEREPSLRMIRTIDGKARAFLSNQYRRVDNDEILEATLPMIRNEYPTQLLNSYVDENKMRIKCLFTGDEHQTVVGKTRDGSDDVVKAGFEMGNHETGGGSFYIRGFFYRTFCLNGCVFGAIDTMSMRQIHVGSKIGIPDGFELSDDTQRKEDELIISAARDVLSSLSSPEFTQKMGARLRAIADTKRVVDPHASVEAVCKELRLSERTQKRALEAFIADQDYTQWGMVNAITNVANTVESYDEASDLEEAGAKIINMQLRQWDRIASLESVAA